jgi:hypothetical protein
MMPGFRRLLLLLLVFLATVGGSAASLLAGTTDPETAPPADAAQGKPLEAIKPKVGFVLQRVGDRYEPVLHFSKAFRLPGTSLRFGSYDYFTPEDEDLPVPKFGFLRDDGRFFYVDELVASDGEAQYALMGKYFIVGGCEGNCGSWSLYLFIYGDHSARLLDKIEDPPGFSPPSFALDYPGEPAYGHKVDWGNEDVPVWVIQEKDHYGHPLVPLLMFRNLPPTVSGPKDYEVFHFYLKIVGGRLRVALDSYLYEPLFRSLGDAGGPYSRSTEYYVSGFLAHKLSLARIKAELGGNKDREWLVHSLKHVKKWDAALHERFGRPLPRIREYKLNRR